MNALTLHNDVLARVPASRARSHERSPRYNLVRTDELVKRASEAGFVAIDGRQNGRRSLHCKHTIVLASDRRNDDGECRIILRNSHDGTTGIQVRGGFYRLVCANGLVVGKTIGMTSIRHDRPTVMDDAVKAVLATASLLGRIDASIERWMSIELSPRQVVDFAIEAAKLRFGDSAGAYRPGALLEARRSADEGRTLWQVFNRVQENTTNATISGQNANGRAINSRRLGLTAAGIDYNARLWDLAAEFAGE